MSDLNTQTHLLGTINNNNNFQLSGGSATNSFLLLNNNVTLQGGGTVSLSTAGGGGSAFIEQAVGGLTLENVNNTIQGNGIIGNNGLSLLNDAGGTILANVNGANLYVNGGGTVTNKGTFQANSGSALVLQNVAFTNYAANTLNGGTYNIYGTSGSAGTLQINPLGNTGGEIVNNAATILLDGPNSNLVDAAGLDALTNFSNNTAPGSFTIRNGRNLTAPGNFANAGTVTVGNASTFKAGPSGASIYTQSGGTTQGIGTIAGKVNLNGGTLLPGGPNAPGTLGINGSYAQSGGTFSEQIAGAGAGQFSVLNVTGGNITLGAAADLNITLLSGFNPVGNTYTILSDSGGIVSGTFANAPASGFQMDGVNWTIAYNSNNIILNGISLVGGLITATWNTAAGNWTTATQWSCAPGSSTCVPNNNAGNVYAAVLNSAGHTLTLDSTSTPSNITVNTLALTAGTLNIGSGATLNLAKQPGGITDIPSGAGLALAGTFTRGGSTSALAGLTSVEGTLTLEDGKTTNVTPGGGTLTDSGTVNVQHTSTLAVNGALTNSGTLNTGNGAGDSGSNAVTASGLLTNSGTITLGATGDSLSAASVANSGAVSLKGDSQALAVGGDFNNNSGGSLTLSADSDSVSVGGNFNNASGASLALNGTKGTVSVSKAFNNNGGSVSLSGSNDSLTAASFNNGGSVSIGGGETVSVTSAYSQTAGGTAILSNGALTAASFSQNGGATEVDGAGTLTAAGGVGVSGGTLRGTGVIVGPVTLSGSGTIMPGTGSTPATLAPGTLTINGTYNQTGGVFDELISSTGNGLLTVSGASVLGLGANLDIDLLGGFTPLSGQTFTILGFATGNGVFANAPASGFQMDGFNWTIAYNPTNIILSAVSPLGALVTATWNTASGNWTMATEWSCAPGPSTCAPNNNAGNVYAAVLNSAGNTLTLDSTSTPSSITVNTLALTAGTLNIDTGATLNLADQPGGIADIPAGAGIVLAGTFEVNGSGSGLANLGTVEGLLTLENGVTTNVTPGSGTLANSGTVNVQHTSTLAVNGALTNSGTLNTGNGASDSGSNAVTASGLLTNSGTITLGATGDSLSAASVANSGAVSLKDDSQALAAGGDFNNNSGGSLTLYADSDSVSVGGNFNNGVGASVTLSGTKGIVSAGKAFNSGTVTLSGTNDNLDAASFTNSGTITVDQNETLSAGAGGFTNLSGGALTINGGGAGAISGGVVQTSGAFTNSTGGNVTVAGGTGGGPGGVLNTTGLFTNSGTVSLTAAGGVPGGFLAALGGFTDSGGSVTIDANSELSVGNNHDYTQTGAGSKTVVNGILTTSQSGNTGNLSLTDGSIQVNNGGSVSSGNNVTNTNGTISIASGGSMTMPGNYTQSGSAAGLTVSGTMAASVADILSGKVFGDGTIIGNVSNSGGMMTPSGAGNPDTLTIQGDFAQGPGGTLMIDLGGTGAGQFSVLDVTGMASLGGAVDFTLLNGFTLTVGDTFTFMNFGSLDSTHPNFASMSFTNFSCPFCIDVFGPNSITFEVGQVPPPVPEPETWLLLAIAGLGMAAYGLRNRCQAKRAA